jgi:sulfatase maturation enzyme AslB (radical SAM superfamily)
VELTESDVAKILSPVAAQLKTIYINGNLGDFSLATQGPQVVQWLLQNTRANININTNGSNHNGAWWAQLVHPRVCITFDLDGLEDTHHLYRLQTDWQRVVRNARAFIAAGGRAVWQMIPFDHNRHQIDACREMSTNMGFEKFVLCDQGRNQGPVYDRQGNFTHWLGTATTPPPPLKDMLESHITWYRADQVRAMGSSNIQCYAQRSREIYIAADGTVYPCCYLGFYPDTMQHSGNEQVKQIAQGNNALEHGLESAVQWFELVEQSWTKQTVGNGQLYTCTVTCGRAS